MSLLADRFAGTAEPEEAPVTTPRPRYPAVPWWAGVYGLDPAVPAGDWDIAARHTAMACAAHVFGGDAGYAGRLFSRKGAPARQWLDWLLGTASPEDADRRRLALRLTCEQSQGQDADGILDDARALHESCSPGRR